MPVVLLLVQKWISSGGKTAAVQKMRPLVFFLLLC
jgi:hypothetical protein